MTFDKLSSQSFQRAEIINESRGFSKSEQKVVFMSYRKKDKQWIKPIVDFLQARGVKVYIDYIDEQLPDKPSSETASILRQRIKDLYNFFLMATPNSKDSKWIPWELWLGDGFDGYKNAIILPVTNYTHNWDKQEYFEIYGYVKEADNEDNKKTDWAVFYPDGSAIWLENWLRN